MLSKNEKRKNLGGILMGFSVLMMGMTLMSDSMSGLSSNEHFTSMMVSFSNPFVGILAGTLLAAVVQSSSAAVGIIQAMAISGSIGFSSVFPLILGQNIGSCVPVLISAVGASKNAKRTSLVYLYFNVIGVIVTGLLFYGLNAVIHFGFMQNEVSSIQIAIINSVFKVFTTIVFFPFIKQLEFIAVKSVRGSDDGKNEQLIDEKFTMSPSYAIEKCREVTIQMAELVEETALCAFSVIKNYTDEKAETITKNEKKTDKFEETLETYLVRVGSMDLSDRDSKRLFMLHHAIENFEQIGDYSEDILKARKSMNKRNANLSDKAKYDLSVMIAAAKKIVVTTTEGFKFWDMEKLRNVSPLEDVIDKLKKELRRRHMERIEAGECSVEQGLPYFDIVSSIEHIADHCSDLALSMIELESGDYNIHTYMRDTRETDENFIENLDSYLEKYSLN